MGIKNLNTLLKRYSSDSQFQLSINDLAGKRLAIDGHNFMYVMMSGARKIVIDRTHVGINEPNQADISREWIIKCINKALQFMQNQITPVFVLDGKHPIEKSETQSKRHAKRAASKIKIDGLYAAIRAGQPVDTLHQLVGELTKELINHVFVTKEDTSLFKMVMDSIGIPCLESNGEGEKLCSMLVIDGLAAASYSNDVDNLAFGCPLVLSSYDERKRNFSAVRLDKVLAGLNLSYEEFVDLCIMSGCDYNTNIPSIASIRSYDLIKKYQSIDKLPNTVLPSTVSSFECLNHQICRRLFSYESWAQMIVTNEPISTSMLNVDKKALATARDCLDTINISYLLPELMSVYSRLVDPVGGSVASLQLQPIIKPTIQLIINPSSDDTPIDLSNFKI